MLMSDFTSLAAFAGTIISVIFLTSLAWKEHHPDNPRSFSTLVAERKELVKQFRIASVVVSTLFTITIFFFIVPKVHYGSTLFVVWATCYISELLVSVFPERGTIEKQLHSFFGYNMALCMVLTTLVLIFSFNGGVRTLELAIFISMLILGAVGQIDRKRFIFYELPFIYMSHASILVAVVALEIKF